MFDLLLTGFANVLSPFVLMLIFFINEWRSSRKMARSKGMRNA